MECILCGWGRIGYSDVSIHAPARGATIAYCTGTENVVVSIHAPTRGATSARSFLLIPFMFQSTHPHGVRQVNGALKHLTRLFQSTHPHGVRRTVASLPLQVKWFQSTHPHGVRPLSKPMGRRFAGFNPRTHTGCDIRIFVRLVLAVFQSTHPHGVRRGVLIEKLARFGVSIHAPTRGATMSFSKAICQAPVSIHAPTRGATLSSSLLFAQNSVSIHAPTRGATVI